MNSFPRSRSSLFGDAHLANAASLSMRADDPQQWLANPYVINARSMDVGLSVAIVDGPYDVAALSEILTRAPVSLGDGSCAAAPSSACHHGTFVIGLLGARRDALIPGLCPDCRLLHVPLFFDENLPLVSVVALTSAISVAVTAGARLINLSLAIIGDDSQDDPGLAAALDYAEANDAVVLVAAGNQGRLAAGQLLSHPGSIPVVAVDAAHRLLPGSNFGPSISRRGVAALGHQVLGYVPGGGTTTMSGTSVATAVATGIVAQVWSARPNVDGATIRAALAGLPRRDGLAPPTLVAGVLLAKLDQILATRSTVARIALQSGPPNSLRSQGESAMNYGSGPQRVFPNSAASSSGVGDAVAPAHGSGGCTCGGASNGSCTCSNGKTSPTRFVYVLGTVDCKFPDQSVSEEFQAAAEAIGIIKGDMAGMQQRDDEPLRRWVHRVLTDDEAKKSGLRYIARQMCWVLTVEKQLAYYLILRDWQDLDDLIACLGKPDEPEDESKGKQTEIAQRTERNRRSHESPKRQSASASTKATEDFNKPLDRDTYDLTLVVGSSSLVPVEASPGVSAPILQVEQLCAYDEDQFIKWCDPLKPEEGGAVQSGATPTPEEIFSSLFRRIVQTADNFGDSDDRRALNFLAVRYKPLYQLYARKVGSGDYDLDSVRVIQSRLWRDRRIVDPVFSFVVKKTGALEKYFVRVDVTCLFPFITHTLQLDRSDHFVPNYFDRYYLEPNDRYYLEPNGRRW